MSFQLKRLKKKAMIFFSCAVNSMVFTSVRFYEFFFVHFSVITMRRNCVRFILKPTTGTQTQSLLPVSSSWLDLKHEVSGTPLHPVSIIGVRDRVTDWGGRLLQQNKISERVTGHTEAPFFFYYLRVRSFTMKPSNSRPSEGGKNPFVHELKLTMTEKIKVRQ